jgi:hypothetical protein
LAQAASRAAERHERDGSRGTHPQARASGWQPFGKHFRQQTSHGVAYWPNTSHEYSNENLREGTSGKGELARGGPASS